MVRHEIFAPYKGASQYVKRMNPETGELVVCELPGDTRSIIRTFSDAGFQLRKQGTEEIYPSGEAFDLEGSLPTYEETNELIGGSGHEV